MIATHSLRVQKVNRRTWKLRAQMPGKNGVHTGYSAQTKLAVN